MKITLITICAITASLAIAFACKKNNNDSDTINTDSTLANRSVTPAFLKKLTGFDNVEVYTLISSDDTLPGFRFAGSADGAGFLKAQDGNGYIMMVNNEDNYSVARLYLDKDLKPVKGEYVLNSDGGQWRLCSGTLATPAEHGFGPLYLSAGESNVEAITKQRAKALPKKISSIILMPYCITPLTAKSMSLI